MKIIPAIDIIDGKCVRLSKGDYNTQKIYNEDPLEIAKAFEDSGICYLHLVDLDGAKSNHIVNHKVLEAISTKTKLKIELLNGSEEKISFRLKKIFELDSILIDSSVANTGKTFNLVWTSFTKS